MGIHVESFIQFIENSGWLGPLFYILLHVIRPLLFIPVLLICLASGVLFGGFFGSIYTFFGLMSTSICFYFLMKYIPWLHRRLSKLKEKVLKKDPDLNVWQLTAFRLVPFVHYHVLSFYLMERSENFRDYVKQTMITIIPMSVVYTTIGHLLYDLNVYGLIIVGTLLLILMIISRNWSEEAITR
ncbi:TVP38/TMEM64 family protein [Alkalicoccobacillus porphyridii]|uniref:TVP38/TMEM64 family protein n=1 Tax=Alkalicoccobacillus porphyridii TaxID=2597270 RepID=UPI00163D4B5E|nr:VTT domain-containing protein [Alkalicoccobacillus porphyridii]